MRANRLIQNRIAYTHTKILPLTAGNSNLKYVSIKNYISTSNNTMVWFTLIENQKIDHKVKSKMHQRLECKSFRPFLVRESIINCCFSDHEWSLLGSCSVPQRWSIQHWTRDLQQLCLCKDIRSQVKYTLFICNRSLMCFHGERSTFMSNSSRNFAACNVCTMK